MLGWLKKIFQGIKKPSSGSQKRQNSYQPDIKYPKVKSPTVPNPASVRETTAETRQTSQKASLSKKPSKAFRSTQKSKTQAPPPPPKATAVWVPPGKSVQVGDYLIPGGMVYVGKRLKTGGSYAQTEPCLINPRLRVDRQRPDHEGSGMDYWPAYSQISPACRAAYLEWLAGERCDPNAYIGYIFLFFYGLERRVLRDYQTLKLDTAEELAQITTEVERLLDIYGDNDSFSGYGARFLTVCRVLHNSEDWARVEPPLTQTGWGMPLNLKLALGRMVADGQPIPMDWMWSWYLHSEQTRLRTPATRCAEEFRKLLRLRYQQRYGEGLVIKPNKRKLKIEYHPASAGFFGVDLSDLLSNIDIGHLPDVTTLSGPLNKLQTLVDDCTDALDPYSRWLGRNRENSDPKAALALLPPELVDDLEDSSVRQLKQWLAQTLGERERVVIAGDLLLSQWSTSPSVKLTKKESITLAQGLEKLGYGIEPDVRFGGKPPKGDRQAVLFRLTDEAMATPSQNYTAATLMMHLAATVANSDAVVDAAEQQYLEEHLESALHLSAAERIRLRAHLTWLLQEKLSLRGLKTKLSIMTSDERAGIANFLISVAGADGHISPQEISMLTKIYPLLGFEADQVYSHIHNFSTVSQMPSAMVEDRSQGTITPVTVRPASTTAKGFAIPAPPETESSSTETPEISQDPAGFTLDLAAIQHKQAESAKVANLLGDLFEEDEPEIVASSSMPVSESEVSIAGLDSLHSQFLSEIAQQTTWDRDALEATADKLGLMLDGALEIINDAAFDACDDPLTDGEDPIEIDTDVLEQLLP
ncbi:MAG: TerB N-terminal domain-containing protein [Leptolyngbyaceae cyanobacterium]